MADTRKFSGITLTGSAPASDDTIVGVTAGGTDVRWTLDQIVETVGGGNTIALSADTAIAAATSVSVNGSGHAAQTWGPALNVAGLVELGNIFSTYSNQSSGAQSPILQMSSTAFVAFLPGNGAIAFSIDPTTGEISLGALNTSSSLSSVGWSLSCHGFNQSQAVACALSATTFAIVYSSGGATYTAVGTLSGLTIFLGTPVQIDASTLYDPQWAVLVTLSASLFVVLYASIEPTTNLVACSVSGTVPSPGTPVQLKAENRDLTLCLDLFALSVNSFIALYGATEGGDNEPLTCIVGSVSGNAITLGSPVSSPDIFDNGHVGFSAIQLSATDFAVAGFANGDSNPTGSTILSNLELLTISGTTPSFGSPVQVPGIPILAALDETHIVVAPGDPGTSSYNAFFMPAIYTLSAGHFSGPAFSPSENMSFGPIAVQSADLFLFTQTSAGVGGNAAYSGFAPSAVFPILEGDSSGNFSAAIFHYGLIGYWLYPIDATHALATLQDSSGTLTARVIGINPINNGPIGFTASAVSEGEEATIQISGVASGFSGLTRGASYYHNGDGNITLGNTGKKAGVALSSSTLLIAA